MKCPKCKTGELNMSFETDHSKPDESIEIQGECDNCGAVLFTFISNDDLIE
jgi:transcriptional regulator NrdR family protein